MDFHEADQQLHRKGDGRRLPHRKIQNNTYLERLSEDEIGLRLYSTYVARFLRGGAVILDSGGWKTMTTRNRLDHVSGWVVFSGRHHARAESHWWLLPTNQAQWWLQRDDKSRWVPFFDGIHLHQRTGEVLSADEELEWAMDQRDPGPSRREQVNDYMSLIVDPDMLPVIARSNESRGIMDQPPYLAARRMLDGGYFGLDVLLMAIDLDIAVQGDFNRSAPQEVFAWLDMMEQGKEPPRFRSIIRRFISHITKEGSYP